MKNPLKYGLLFLILISFCLPSSALITADNTAAEQDPVGLNWDYVYEHPDGSAVAVGTHWVLTAAHVADYGGSGTLSMGGTNYFQQDIIYHVAADLALIRYDKALPGYYPLHTGVLVGESTLMVGYGNTGTVTKVGPNYFFQDSGSGRGTERWGSNQITQLYDTDYDVGGLTGWTTNSGFLMKFDAGGTEAGVGIYDSGGGTFVESDGVWKLAGINTIRLTTDAVQGYNYSFSIAMPDYGSWVAQTIAAEDGDDDSDGIPNWWEDQYGSTTGVISSVDQDGDGAIGTDEYIADTDPTDSNAVWQASGTFSFTNQTFTFDGSTARQYQLLYTTNNLADPGLTWITNRTPIWGTGVGTEISITNLEDTVFYRVWVTLP